MVRECLESESPFGMLLALPDGIVRVGCTAEVLNVTKRYDDGRIDILTIGRHPFRVVELFDNDPLLEGSIDYLEDEDSLSEPRKQEELVELYEACYTLLFEGMPKSLHEARPQPLSYAVTSALPLDLLWKQQILELRSEGERQDRLRRYLREWTLHLQKIETLRRRGGGNGHGSD
jgi:Lon protease-like protein